MYTHTCTHIRACAHTPTHVYTRDAMIHILDVLIYHLFCIMIQRYIAQYEIAEFCRQIGPFFKNIMFYTYQNITELKLAYNYNINHNQLQHQSEYSARIVQY